LNNKCDSLDHRDRYRPNSTGVFNGSGAFSNAIPINPAEATRFFRLKTP